jgi:hypothetical protein
VIWWTDSFPTRAARNRPVARRRRIQNGTRRWQFEACNDRGDSIASEEAESRPTRSDCLGGKATTRRAERAKSQLPRTL